MIKKNILTLIILSSQLLALSDCADLLLITHDVPQVPSLTEERGTLPSVRIKSTYFDKWWFNDSIGNSSDFFYVVDKDFDYWVKTIEGKTETRMAKENTIYYQPTRVNKYFAETGKDTVGYKCGNKLMDEFSFKYEEKTIPTDNENLTGGFKKIMSNRWDAFWLNGTNASELLVLTEKTGKHTPGEIYYEKNGKYVLIKQFSPSFTRVEYAACCTLSPTTNPTPTPPTPTPTIQATTKPKLLIETTIQPSPAEANPTTQATPSETTSTVAARQDSTMWILVALALVVVAAAVFYFMAKKPTETPKTKPRK